MRPAAVWEETLNRAGVPAGRVLTIPQVLEEPQVAERGAVALSTMPCARAAR